VTFPASGAPAPATISCMAARKMPPPSTPADLPAEKAFSVLSIQLKSLQELKALRQQEGEAKESEWTQLTAKLIMRAFGSDSPNKSNFSRALSAGEYQLSPYGPNHALDQRNYEARIQAYEGVLNSCLAELKIDLPEPDIQAVFEPGQEYEFYRTVKTILGFAAQEIFVIDPYLSVEMFDVYAGAISRAVSFRLLSANVPAPVHSIAQKYASGGNLQFRDSNAIHDRILFADNRVWVVGQSLKDAAKKKPTYVVEHDEPLMRAVYEEIWSKAKPLI
jgi:hypothetical protein